MEDTCVCVYLLNGTLTVYLATVFEQSYGWINLVIKVEAL